MNAFIKGQKNITYFDIKYIKFDKQVDRTTFV